MNTKIYLSGGITKVPNFRHVFKMAEIELKNWGWEVFNPCEFTIKISNPSWYDYMKHDIQYLCKCDSIYMLKGWWKSKGARIEWLLAKVLKIHILYQ